MQDGPVRTTVIPVVAQEDEVLLGVSTPPGLEQPLEPPPGVVPPPGPENVPLDALEERDMICITLQVPFSGKDAVDALIAEANTRQIATSAMGTILNSQVLMERIKREAANNNIPEKTVVCRLAVEYAEELMLHLYRTSAPSLPHPSGEEPAL
jgi:hypothetical protein